MEGVSVVKCADPRHQSGREGGVGDLHCCMSSRAGVRAFACVAQGGAARVSSSARYKTVCALRGALVRQQECRRQRA
eukprot:10713882-Lingulodinium_polyedra.AAC.1